VPCRLAEGVQVRKESWGLLFYRPASHKICFVRSGDWLSPECFDGTRTPEEIIDDIAGRTGAPREIIERSLSKLTERLLKSRVIAHEVR
jgi:hypothetical protein